MPSVSVSQPFAGSGVSVTDLDVVVDYLGALRARGRSPTTIAHYEYCIRRLEHWVVGPGSEQYKPGGVMSRLRALKAYFSWLVPMTDRSHVAITRWLRRRGVAEGSLWSLSDPHSLVKAVVDRPQPWAVGSRNPCALRSR